MTIHVVGAGESAYTIALDYGVSAERLIQENGITDPNRLAVGQTLVIQYPETVHRIAPGDTLTGIARQYGVTVNQLLRNNRGLAGRNLLIPGEDLVISYQQAKYGEMSVNGYAYPFIEQELLLNTLPYLTYLTPFTYGFTAEGELVDLDDQELIARSWEFGVGPLMHLSTLTEEGGFSNDLAHIALNDLAVQERLIQNVLETIQRKGYYGLDVDFEFVFPEDRVPYADFIRNITQQLNREGYQVICALAPKTSSDQKGLLYEGHDYALIGAAANAVLLMTYEWGYTYGPPMAVAPIPNVRAVLDYAVTQIPRDKIYMGVPAYGYDWPLPFVQGTTRARSISCQEAIDLAVQYGVEIQYDENAQAPFFTYYDESGVRHEVWFEDARSIREKLALIPEYDFLGVGYWNLMRPFPQNWLVLNALYNIRRIG